MDLNILHRNGPSSPINSPIGLPSYPPRPPHRPTPVPYRPLLPHPLPQHHQVDIRAARTAEQQQLTLAAQRSGCGRAAAAAARRGAAGGGKPAGGGGHAGTRRGKPRGRDAKLKGTSRPAPARRRRAQRWRPANPSWAACGSSGAGER